MKERKRERERARRFGQNSNDWFSPRESGAN